MAAESWRKQMYLLWSVFVFWTPLCWGRPDPQQRQALLQQEVIREVGGSVVLNDKEKLLNQKLHQLKLQEMELPEFPPAMHFFKAKPLIEQSAVFSFLQKMPKGAALHVHDFALVGVEWLVKNVTYRENCYVCFTDDNSVRFLFSTGKPKYKEHCSTWTLLKTLRLNLNSTELDNSFIRNLTLFTEDPDKAYPNQDVVWKRFEQAFLVAYGLVTYAPVFKDYFYEGLRQFYMDNIIYLEIRALLPPTYELDGRRNSRDWSLRTCQKLLQQFRAQYPDFLGARVIFTVHRGLNLTEAVKAVEEAMTLQRNFPDIIAGFDFVGREDTGRPLWYFRDALEVPEKQGIYLPYFFHAGETDLEGTDVDQNLMDALLFNTSRIGHGFAITRHPVVKELARKMDVALEVCPISNQKCVAWLSLHLKLPICMMCLGRPRHKLMF
ncbi:adenosine deaminase 2-A isoform X2 [Hoplias malabaricus]|uniref:adenosine deaminase 2-A isoform X2 n=2 Tax=Hoplias malabaricus TaxID=27720 RepID=UPI003462B2E3